MIVITGDGKKTELPAKKPKVDADVPADGNEEESEEVQIELVRNEYDENVIISKPESDTCDETSQENEVC